MAENKEPSIPQWLQVLIACGIGGLVIALVPLPAGTKWDFHGRRGIVPIMTPKTESKPTVTPQKRITTMSEGPSPYRFKPSVIGVKTSVQPAAPPRPLVITPALTP